MENLALKIRIAVLWLFTEGAMLACGMLCFMEPGAIQQIMAGVIGGWQIGPEMLLFLGIVFWVPLVMAFLSVTLKDSLNRWVNIILGVVFTGLGIFDFIDHLAPPIYHGILIWGSIVVVTAMIVWYAWKWPKQEV